MSENVLDPSTPAPATPGAPSAPTTQAAPAAVPATPSTPAAPPTGDPAMVPSYRIRETREAVLREAQENYARKEAEIRAESNRYREQVLALTGVTPPPNPEIANVKKQFGSVFPGLAQLEDHAQEILSLREQRENLEAQASHYWEAHARSTMDRLYTLAQESLGIPLTDEGKRQLHSSFAGYIGSSPELTSRFASDPSVVKDFWTQFTSSFIDPVRRVAAAQTVARVPGALPQDSPSGALPISGGAPKGQSLDERVASAWSEYNKPK